MRNKRKITDKKKKTNPKISHKKYTKYHREHTQSPKKNTLISHGPLSIAVYQLIINGLEHNKLIINGLEHNTFTLFK